MGFRHQNTQKGKNDSFQQLNDDLQNAIKNSIN